jgi:type I restriction enzyme S subunit
MASWLSELGYRLDVNPYISGAIEARKTIEKLSTVSSLEKFTKGGREGLVNPGRIPRLWVTDEREGTRFLSGRDILHSDLSRLRLISNKAVRANPKLTIEKDWILITRSGTVGRTILSRKEMEGMACTEDVLRVVPDPSLISPEYLYAFLRSKFGIPIVVSGTYGAIIQHIEPVHLHDLPVPRFTASFEEKVAKKVRRYVDGLDHFSSEINKATKQCLAASGLSGVDRQSWQGDRSDLSFMVKRNDLRSLRAWNHSVKSRKIESNIKKGNWDFLGDLVDLDWLKWRVMFQRKTADREFAIEVLSQKQLFSLQPEGKWVSRNYLLNHSDKYIVPEHTILIAKQGTLGENELFCRSEFVCGKSMLNRAYSDHCMRIVSQPKKIHPGYLFAFLRSEPGFRLLRSLAEGSKQQDLHFSTVPKIPIPRLSRKLEQKIGDATLNACNRRSESMEQEKESIRLIEQEIERASNG